MEFTPVDAPVLREKRQPARQSGLGGKVVVITGAVAGIGRATALCFAEEGARIAAWDVSTETAPQLESAIKRAGGESHFQAVDVSDASAVESAAAALVAHWGRIDVLINNAGIVRDAQLVKWNVGSPESIMSEEVWDAVIGVNLKGVFLVTRADELRRFQGRCHRNDADLGTGVGQVQDSRQCRGSGIYCDRNGEGDARESPRIHGGANTAGTSRNSGRRGQYIFMAGFGPGKLHSRGCDFRGRRRHNRNL